MEYTSGWSGWSPGGRFLFHQAGLTSSYNNIVNDFNSKELDLPQLTADRAISLTKQFEVILLTKGRHITIVNLMKTKILGWIVSSYQIVFSNSIFGKRSTERSLLIFPEHLAHFQIQHLNFPLAWENNS